MRALHLYLSTKLYVVFPIVAITNHFNMYLNLHFNFSYVKFSFPLNIKPLHVCSMLKKLGNININIHNVSNAINLNHWLHRSPQYSCIKNSRKWKFKTQATPLWKYFIGGYTLKGDAFHQWWYYTNACI